METSFAQLCFELDEFHRSDQARPLHVYTVLPKIEVGKIPDLAREAGVGAVIKKIGNNVYDLEIVSAHKRNRAFGWLVDFKNYWIILFRTIESPTFAGNITKRWIERMYPVISRSYIKPSDLLRIMDHLSDIKESRLELRGYILRSHDRPETTKKWPKGTLYSRTMIENTISNENKLLEGINFIFSIDETFFDVRMQIDGHFVFYRGGSRCFSNFQRLILSSYNEIALFNRNFFADKERREIDGNIEIHQIYLQPKEKLTKGDLETLSLYLSTIYSIAIFHSGNPWLLLNAIDRGDGSSFDIYGYTSEIQIVPFNKATPESLMRLCYNITEVFPLATLNIGDDFGTSIS
jgi:hypothetical protein